MKLAIFVVDDARADRAVDALVRDGLRVTRLASTGGFLRRGNTTLLVGAEDNEVEQATAIIHAQAPNSVLIIVPLERYEHL